MARLGEASPAHSKLTEVRKAADRAAKLTRQLLAFSRKQVLHPEVVQPGEVIADLASMVQRIIGEDIALMPVLHPQIGRIRVDRSQLEQAIINLAVNARDAMPKGGKLIVEIEDVDIDEDHHDPFNLTAGSYVMLAISDTGCGMPPAVLSRIFEPFFTTKEAGKGTGLGLSMVYGFVKQSGGHIKAYSEVGVGTTFKIFLPKWVSSAAAAYGRQEAPPVEGGVETILLVEDSAALRDMTAEILTSHGYRVITAEDAFAALDVLKSDSEIDLLLTDVVLPNMSGGELAQRVRQERPTVKVLFMSGYTADAVAGHGVAVEGSLLLDKPFTGAGLLATVRKALDGSP